MNIEWKNCSELTEKTDEAYKKYTDIISLGDKVFRYACAVWLSHGAKQYRLTEDSIQFSGGEYWGGKIRKIKFEGDKDIYGVVKE